MVAVTFFRSASGAEDVNVQLQGDPTLETALSQQSGTVTQRRGKAASVSLGPHTLRPLLTVPLYTWMPPSSSSWTLIHESSGQILARLSLDCSPHFSISSRPTALPKLGPQTAYCRSQQLVQEGRQPLQAGSLSICSKDPCALDSRLFIHTSDACWSFS